MSMVVFQGFQYCLESHPVETRTLPQFLGIKKITEKCYYDETHNMTRHGADSHSVSSSNPDSGGWTFLQSLSNTSQTAKETPTAYVSTSIKGHPSSMLTQKSLELCTENLGSETGTRDIIETNIFLPSASDSESRKAPTRVDQSRLDRVKSRNFPPPLSTISGVRPLQLVKSRREGGRLIIQAVEEPLAHTYLQAERSHGRLRLCLVKDCVAPNLDSEAPSGEENEESSQGNGKGEFENEANDEEHKEEVAEEEEEEEEEEDNMEDNSFDVGTHEMGTDELQWPSRCKEGRSGTEGLCNWEPFWVAAP